MPKYYWQMLTRKIRCRPTWFDFTYFSASCWHNAASLLHWTG